jgi:hypothetical protein
MSRQANISGTVTDASGAPLEDAEVYLFREDLAGSGGIVVATTTDSDGNYQFISHPDQTGNVEDWHLGYKYNASDDKFFASNWGVGSALGATSNFSVVIDSTTSPVAPGNTLDVTTTVTETGGLTDTQTVTLSINNGVGTEDTTTLSLPAGNSSTTTLSWSVPSGQTKQNYTATVSSEDDTASQTVTVGTATPTLPNSARNRWKIGANTGSTLNDSVGSADGTINDATRSSDANAQSGETLIHDGSNDYTGLTKLGSFGSNLTTDFAIAVTIETTTTPSGGAVIAGQSSSDGSGGTGSDATTIRNKVVDDTTLRFNLTDQDNDEIKVETSSLDSTFSDGNKHRYVYNKTSNSASGLVIWQDAVQQSMSTVTDAAFDNTIDFDLNPVQLCRTQFNGGFVTDYLVATIDDVVIYQSSLSSSEIQDDYDIQPWS